MLHLPESLTPDFGDWGVVAKSALRRAADRALRNCANQLSFEAIYAKSLLFIFYPYESKRTILSQDTYDFSLDPPFLFDIAEMAVRLAIHDLHEVNLPDAEAGVPSSVENHPTNVLSEDAAVMRGRFIAVKRHLSIIEQVMLRDATPEIPIPVRPHANDSREQVAMSGVFVVFVKEVDAVWG